MARTNAFQLNEVSGGNGVRRQANDLTFHFYIVRKDQGDEKSGALTYDPIRVFTSNFKGQLL